MNYAICLISSAFVVKRFSAPSYRPAYRRYLAWLKENVKDDRRSRFHLYRVVLTCEGFIKYYPTAIVTRDFKCTVRGCEVSGSV